MSPKCIGCGLCTWVVPTETLGFGANGLDLVQKQRIVGLVTFLVGKKRREITAPKNLLAVRSEVFNNMFSIGMKERDAKEVAMPEEDPEAFDSLVKYLATDATDEIDADFSHAFRVKQLAFPLARWGVAAGDCLLVARRIWAQP